MIIQARAELWLVPTLIEIQILNLSHPQFFPCILIQLKTSLQFFIGITGLEATKLVPDNCMENVENYSDDEEGSESRTESDISEYDSDGLRAYTVASNTDFVPQEIKTKVKTKGGKQAEQKEVEKEVTSEVTEVTEVTEDPWSQAQQKALEGALVQFPKGSTERWERIANKVPEKTKEQCIKRFKTLAEMVKKKKEATVES